MRKKRLYKPSIVAMIAGQKGTFPQQVPTKSLFEKIFAKKYHPQFPDRKQIKL